ncbi:MAG: M56 family metallopeptidase [Gammaproteobacteria bacterium]|nr:TonB family protein [Gammaproteobacteria bacterium]MDE1984008.1 M56 family metallopeptidase [Gammaproteobacteria bacterium]
MNTFATLFDSSVLLTLGWTLVHFLWQGAAVGALYALLRRMLRNKSPVTRYNLAVVTLIAMAALPIVTFIHLSAASASGSATLTLSNFTVLTAAKLRSHTPIFTSWLDTAQSWLKPLLSWAVLLWFLGVLVMSVRIGYGWRHARFLRRTADFAPLPQWNAIVKDLSCRLGIRNAVRLAVSLHVHVPSVIGWLKPVILLPPSMLSGLTPLQIELILAHELAHVRRCDYLWNLLQVTVETLLFYHPVVRWVSNQARVEREQCCDDMVVALHGNPLAYARALTELEGLRHPQDALLLGANGGQVLDRIHRLLGRSATSVPVAWSPLLLAACLVLAGGFISTSPLKTVWRGASTVKYSFSGQQVEAAPADKTMPVSVQPTNIVQTAPIQPDPAYIPLPGGMPAVHIAAPAAPAALDIPATPRAVDVAAAGSDPSPARSGGEVLARYSPQYPAFAQERGVEGDARITFTLTKDAEIADARVVRVTGSDLFGQAALRAIQRWKFTPAILSGKPVAQQMTVDFVFRLHAATTQSSGPCKAPMGYHVCIN